MNRAERYPFPDACLPLLAEWHGVAKQVTEGRNTRTGLNGDGPPAGPRDWDDTGIAYKSFLVVFLPIDGGLVNHNLSVVWRLRNGGVDLRAGNHLGRNLTSSWSRPPEVDAFRTELVWAATHIGLLSIDGQAGPR